MSLSNSSDSADSDEEGLQDRFGPLLSLDSNSMIALASNIRNRVEGDYTSRKGAVSVSSGSFNLVHIIQFPDAVRYVIRIPATGWGDRFDSTARQAFVSQALTMRFIADHTQIPVPRVYEFDASIENEIGAPYIAMSYIFGHTVASTWFDDKGSTPIEERRGRTLDTVAQAVCQLEQLRFDKIGSLQFRQNEQIAVGPCFVWDQGEFGAEDFGKRLQVKAFGPFQSTRECLNDCLRRSRSTEREDPLGLGAEKVIAKAISYIPTPQNGKETFALSIPDFDSQNIMIDEQGNLTGIIDWDNVQTEPDCVGPCRYPGWITRDWDPLMYGYPVLTEDSPHQLSQYRRRYHAQIERSRRCANSDLAQKSHIFEAVAIAAANRHPRLEIALKFVGRALQIDDPEPQYFVTDLGNGEISKKAMQQFEKRLKAILAIRRSKRHCSPLWLSQQQ